MDWISVKDQQPPINEECLIFCTNYRCYTDAFFDGTQWETYQGICSHKYVTHWIKFVEPDY